MRLLPALLIGFAVLVSVGAVSSILQMFGLGVDEWYGTLSLIDRVYQDLLGNAFNAFSAMAMNRFNIGIPGWVPHVAVLYLGAALAFISGSTGIAHRERIIETIKATALGAVVPLAIPLFIWQALRLGLVSRFARENTLSFFAYVVLVAGVYFGAVFANGTVFKPQEAVAGTANTAAMNRSEIAALEKIQSRAESEPGAEALVDFGKPVAIDFDTLGPGDAKAIGEALGSSFHARAEHAGTTAEQATLAGDQSPVPAQETDDHSTVDPEMAD